MLSESLWMAAGMLAAARGDQAAAAQANRWLEEHHVDEFRRLLRNHSRMIGIIARAAGDHETAQRRFEAAVAELDQAGRVVPASWSRFHLAETLLDRGDQAAAAALLAEARAAAEPLGMKLLLRRIADLEGGSAEASPRGLTSRELEVLRLIAGGATNKEIGYQLGIADKTTEAHVRNLYRKIGVGSRAEATELAVREGLA